MSFTDRVLKCVDCGKDFVFTAGEQIFFREKQFEHDPKRCKNCKLKHQTSGFSVRVETRTVCAQCGEETTVPFRPRLATPVLCRSCYQQNKVPRAAEPAAVHSN